MIILPERGDDLVVCKDTVRQATIISKLLSVRQEGKVLDLDSISLCFLYYKVRGEF